MLEQAIAELRAEIDKGIRSLDAGKGMPLDINEFIAQQHRTLAGLGPATHDAPQKKDPAPVTR